MAGADRFRPARVGAASPSDMRKKMFSGSVREPSATSAQYASMRSQVTLSRSARANR
jgi:hypothetical protein